MASLVRLRSIGQCAVDVGTVRVAHDAKMRFALLLYLAIERGKQIPRGTLAECCGRVRRRIALGIHCGI